MSLHLVPLSLAQANEHVAAWHRHNNPVPGAKFSIATDGTRNANSMLYGAAARATFALGYTRLITYTQADESGSSLRAAGWKVIAQRDARPGWTTPSRPRADIRSSGVARQLWEKVA